MNSKYMIKRIPIVTELITIREKWGLSQEDTAKLAAVELNYFKRLERGEDMPSLALLVRWADTLGCNITAKVR